MKIYDKKTGVASHHESIDARELVQSGAYSYTDPNAKPGDAPEKTAGEVLRDSEKQRHDENMRSQYQQMADATIERDRRQMEEINPAARAAKAAADARAHADHMAKLAAAGGHPPLGVVATPQSLAKLKADADAAEKDAKEKEAMAKKAADEQERANEEMRKQNEKEAAAAEKAAGKKGKGEGVSGTGVKDKDQLATGSDPEDELDEMSKPDLQAWLDDHDVEYSRDDLKEDLLKKAKAAQKKK